MRHSAFLLGLALCLFPAPWLRGQDATLKDAFAAAKAQWAMQGDREGAAARFEAVLATLEQKGFLKDTGKGLDDLIVKIDKIPTEKDIKINIQTTVTGDGKEYLNKEGISSGTTRTGGPGLQGG